jgi:hypothetical protein
MPVFLTDAILVEETQPEETPSMKAAKDAMYPIAQWEHQTNLALVATRNGASILERAQELLFWDLRSGV